MKHFFWKACHDILPINQNLFKKYVLQNPLCPICTREGETTIHALWSCPTTSDVWGFETNSMIKWTNSTPSIWFIWKQMVDNFNHQDLKLNVIILKQIWAKRNLVIFDDTFKSLISVIQKPHSLQPSWQIKVTILEDGSLLQLIKSN